MSNISNTYGDGTSSIKIINILHKYILKKAYDSLVNQTNKDFEWIITDDGSTDNTSELVKSWKLNDNGFDIIYNKLNHIGIPRALNYGVQSSNTGWFMMLDSDDYILPNTVELVLNWLEEIKDDEKNGWYRICTLLS